MDADGDGTNVRICLRQTNSKTRLTSKRMPLVGLSFVSDDDNETTSGKVKDDVNPNFKQIYDYQI